MRYSKNFYHHAHTSETLKIQAVQHHSPMVRPETGRWAPVPEAGQCQRYRHGIIDLEDAARVTEKDTEMHDKFWFMLIYLNLMVKKIFYFNFLSLSFWFSNEVSCSRKHHVLRAVLSGLKCAFPWLHGTLNTPPHSFWRHTVNMFIFGWTLSWR